MTRLGQPRDQAWLTNTAQSFIQRTASAEFDATEAFAMLQHRYTMDYGRRSSGSMPASDEDEYYPIFHLDMMSVVGQPLRAITHRSSFFDNVTFSFQHWQAPYISKHAIHSLPFELAHRTFRVAMGASREIWFIVMHPVQAEMLALPGPRQARGRAEGRSAVRQHHAEALARYIKDIFLDGALLGEGIEPSWALGDRRSQNISFEKWTAFQTLFMQKWSIFATLHAYDEFWLSHRPAFHAYDHGANIEIEVHDGLRSLPRETRLRTDEDASDSDGSSDGESDAEEAPQPTGERQTSSGREDTAELGSPAATEQLAAEHGALYTGGLEQLRGELEQKFNLDNIAQISYAIAADINCLEGSAVDRGQSESEVDQEPLCLLADRCRVAEAYGSAREATFYSLAFHPRYGNFSSKRPPDFLHDLYTVMRDNSSLQNDGHDVLLFEGFQGYASGIKRSVRHRKEDLLARKGSATAALTLPPAEVRRSPATVKAKNEQLLREVRGERTPEQPASSTPFARERGRIEAAVEQEQLAFRMEQVVTIKTSLLVPQQRSFYAVLRPIFQIMRFFLKEPAKYTRILRRFRPSIFPGVLAAFARVFEVAFAEMTRRFRAKGVDGLSLALCESIAVLDRLGNYCFTGDPRVLPSTVLGPLVTMESIRKGGWPFISPSMLDFREADGRMNMIRWPRSGDRQNRPLLLHVAALGYHYGPLVAANRHSQVWFGQLAGQGIRDLHVAVRFLEDVFREIWVPQTMGFIALQLRRQVMRGARSGASPEENSRQAEQLSSLLTAWESSEAPFSEQYVPLLYDSTQANPPAPVPGSTIGSSAVVQAAYSATSTRHARHGKTTPEKSTRAAVARKSLPASPSRQSTQRGL